MNLNLVLVIIVLLGTKSNAVVNILLVPSIIPVGISFLMSVELPSTPGIPCGPIGPAGPVFPIGP
jgi:hypothetical protein